MKKLLVISLTVLLAALLIVSCSPEQKIEDELALISFNTSGKGTTRSLTRTNPKFDSEDFYWSYTAKKTDETGLITGTETTPKAVKEGKGLATVGPFSYGSWSFTLYGYVDDARENLVYEGTSPITISKTTNTLSVTVEAKSTGKNGYLEFPAKGTIALTGKNVTPDYSKFVEKIEIKSLAEEAAEPTVVYDKEADTGKTTRTFELKAGSYSVTVSYLDKKDVDDEGNAIDDVIVYATDTILVEISDYLTTKIGGDIGENTGAIDIAVKKNGEVEYTTLSDAIADAADGDTLVLMQSVDLGSAETMSIDKSITLDLNGNTITSGKRVFMVKKGTLTITNGTIEADVVDNNGSSVIRVDCADGDATVVLKSNATIKAPSSYGITAFGTANKATLDIYGTIESTNPCISGNGSDSYSGNTVTVNIYDGAVLTKNASSSKNWTSNNDKVAVYQPNAGVLNIKGGTITCEDGSAVEIRAGKADISGGTLISYAGYGTNSNGNGPTVSGAAVAASQHTTKKSIDVTISGGTFTADKQLAVVNTLSTNSSVENTKLVKVTVGNGVSMDVDKIVGVKTAGSTGVDGVYYVDYESARADGVDPEKIEVSSGVNIRGIAGYEYKLFATANDAYAAINSVLSANGGLEQEGLKDEEFKALFTDIDNNSDARVIWTIYGEQSMVEDSSHPYFMTFGRKASHYSRVYGEGVNHFSRIEFVGGNDSAKLICSKLTFPYEWWGENHKSEVSFKNLVFESSNGDFFSFTLTQGNNDGLVASFENCTFSNGRVGLYNNKANEFTFTKCKFDGNGKSESAIQIQGSETEVTKNTITGCEFKNSRGIDIGQATAVAVIEGNTFINCGNQTDDAAKNHHSAIKITRGNTFTISNNTIKDCKGTAIYVRGNGSSDPFKGTLTITNNTISNCTYAFCDLENGEHSLYTLNTSGNTITNTETTKCSRDGVVMDITAYLK